MGGGVEVVNCELNLLKCATENKHYRYYHLLSGHDLPIKTQDIIHKWFDENERNYVSFYRPVMRENALYNYRIYHFQFKKYFWVRLSRKLQSILRIDRIKKSGLQYMKGSQWFSVTDEAARYIVKKEKLIQKLFSYTRCPDEVFIQTILYNSYLKDKLEADFHDIEYRTLSSTKVMGNKRVMDWPDALHTAHPRTLLRQDYDLLMNRSAFFARKFDSKVDSKIIDMIYNDLKKQ